MIATSTIFVSGTASARRPMPLRARSSRPSERVPSGKTPMQAPSRSASIARSSAPRSPLPRSIGIWPMPSRIGPSPRTSQRLALRQRADLAVVAGGDADRDRVHVGVVVAGEQHGARARQRLEPLDLHPPPPRRDRRAERHRDAVGAGEGFRLRGYGARPRRPAGISSRSSRYAEDLLRGLLRRLRARCRARARGSPAARTDPRRR